MPDEIKMDRKVFEALASETRINILKTLDSRQMTITELSQELEMAKSSIHEHLGKMQGSGLVEKVEDGRKWTYYYLTGKGRNILHPHETAKILVLLGMSLLSLVGGFSRVFQFGPVAIGANAPITEQTADFAAPATAEMESVSEGTRAVESAVSSGFDYTTMLGVLLILIGIMCGILAYRMWIKRGPGKVKANERLQVRKG